VRERIEGPVRATASSPSGPATVQEGIPPSRSQREALLRAAEDYVRQVGLTPPLTLEELTAHTSRMLQSVGMDRRYHRYAAVLVNNETWRERLAGIPYDRRLLMLPQCLRPQGLCPAEVDEFGLVCRRCGRCPIGAFVAEAERLGYAVLTAEGTTVVTSLIASGKVEAVVGVSCLAVLERVFRFVEAAAVPGLAIPLLRDGCANTTTDLDWVWDAIYLTSRDRTRRLDLDALRAEVGSWFAPQALADALGAPAGKTEELALAWLARGGKRWRPFLMVCAFQALQHDPQGQLPEDLRRAALAIECFHKASLVHDDIEDDDPVRYGQPTLHEAHGVPVALNVGDYLLGLGYGLIARCGAGPERVQAMLQAAAEGHRKLALGQGAELCWRRDPRPMDAAEVLGLYALKTAPAFEVALHLGAILAGADAATRRALSRYSEAFGVAYQIRDDIDDLLAGGRPGGAAALGPSLLLALARRRARGDARRLLEALWRGRVTPADAAGLADTLVELGAEELARRLLEVHKDRALRALQPLENANLKGLLRRVIAKVFNEFEHPAPSSHEHPRGNAGRGRASGPAR